jgi:hypothetical protein
MPDTENLTLDELAKIWADEGMPPEDVAKNIGDVERGVYKDVRFNNAFWKIISLDPSGRIEVESWPNA